TLCCLACQSIGLHKEHQVKSVVDVVDDEKAELKKQIDKLRPVAIACEYEAEALEKIIQDINDSEARSGESIEKEFVHLVNLLTTRKEKLKEELKQKSQTCRDNLRFRQENLNNMKSSLNKGLREAEHTLSLNAFTALSQTKSVIGQLEKAKNDCREYHHHSSLPTIISFTISSQAIAQTVASVGSVVEALASMSSARYGHTATLLLSGKVLVTDGQGSSTCEVYDPLSNTWTPVASMSSAQYWHTATLLLSGKVLVTGGGSLSTCQVYDPASDKWTPVASMSSARYGHTATLLSSGKVLVTGGQGSSTCEVYDPASNTWTPVASMSSARYGHNATLLSSGKVLVTGGQGLSTCEVYDPLSNTWTPVASMASARYWHPATLLSSGKVLVTGGQDLSSCEVYDW
ncbi:unnamed protein product, partial [Didymodactylos carnosus]